MKIRYVLVLTWLALSPIGCATILVGRHQEIQVASLPPGAKASTEGQDITTPGTFNLLRNTNHVIVIEKEGYLPETVTLTSGVGAAVAGNLLFGRLIGTGIDAATGAMYRLSPEAVNVELKPASPPVEDPQPEKSGDKPE